MTLIPTDKNKDMLKHYGELWGKIKDLITSTNYNLDEFDGKYMKIKLTSNYDLPQRKTLELHEKIIVNRSVFSDIVNTIHKFS